MSYVPPEESAIAFGNKKSEVEETTRPTFEFDPKRSEQERVALIATDGSSDPQGGLIRFWSHSSLQQFQTCPFRLYLRRVKRIKEPDSDAANRGTLIHDEAEAYVKGEREELPSAKKADEFENRFNLLKTMYDAGKVEMEQNWGFDIDWNPIEDDGKLYKNPKLWALTKLDVFIRENPTSARIIDHKTGKKWGNEVKHGGQAMEYAISAFMRFPELEHVTTEFWYLDTGEESIRTYTRGDIMLLLPRLTTRAIKLTSATKFPPKPSDTACKWCTYPASGDCEYGGMPV